MIKPNELRLGNYVNYDGVYENKNNYQPLGWEYFLIKGNGKEFDISPIPLTPEILIKCGFTYGWQFNNGDVECYDNGIIHIQICFIVDPITFEFVFRDNKDEQQQQVVKLFYLHQLQNLYYALTGQELEVNL